VKLCLKQQVMKHIFNAKKAKKMPKICVASAHKNERKKMIEKNGFSAWHTRQLYRLSINLWVGKCLVCATEQK
jgi:hypothetical protein